MFIILSTAATQVLFRDYRFHLELPFFFFLKFGNKKMEILEFQSGYKGVDFGPLYFEFTMCLSYFFLIAEV